MSRFLDTARELLEAAETASRLNADSGLEPVRDWTVLIGPGGGVSLVAGSDWPLDSLRRERGASIVYRIRQERDRLVVEGRAGDQACLLATAKPNGAARTLLSDQKLYQVEPPRLMTPAHPAETGPLLPAASD